MWLSYADIRQISHVLQLFPVIPLHNNPLTMTLFKNREDMCLGKRRNCLYSLLPGTFWWLGWCPFSTQGCLGCSRPGLEKRTGEGIGIPLGMQQQRDYHKSNSSLEQSVTLYILCKALMEGPFPPHSPERPHYKEDKFDIPPLLLPSPSFSRPKPEALTSA